MPPHSLHTSIFTFPVSLGLHLIDVSARVRAHTHNRKCYRILWSSGEPPNVLFTHFDMYRRLLGDSLSEYGSVLSSMRGASKDHFLKSTTVRRLVMTSEPISVPLICHPTHIVYCKRTPIVRTLTEASFWSLISVILTHGAEHYDDDASHTVNPLSHYLTHILYQICLCVLCARSIHPQSLPIHFLSHNYPQGTPRLLASYGD